MVLDGLSLLDEGVLGRCEAALQGGAEDGVDIGGAQLGRRAEELSLEHFVLSSSLVVGGEMVLDYYYRIVPNIR